MTKNPLCHTDNLFFCGLNYQEIFYYIGGAGIILGIIIASIIIYNNHD